MDLWLAVEVSRADLEKWLPWVPFTPDLEAMRRYTMAAMADWDGHRACRFVIRAPSTHRLLGVVGIESLTNLHANGDLGYWLRSDATGAGLMTEAARLVLTWAFGPLGAHRIRVAASTENHASLGVIRRLGFRFEGIARQAEFCHHRWLDHAVFARLASDPGPPPK
jgi:ribosomal-protein-serine acetyltransferase